MSGTLKPGIYKHFKGGIYDYVCTALQEADLEPMVVYKTHNTNDFWVRPLSEFTVKFKWLKDYD